MKRCALILMLAASLNAAEWNHNDPKTWVTYGKNYYGWRYSEVRQINAANVSQLTPQWVFQTGMAGKSISSSIT